jgi:hypothetical protein
VYAVQQKLSYKDNKVEFVRLLQVAQDASVLIGTRTAQAKKRAKENRMLEKNI